MDALWLSPVYPSPMVDFGYDISDYRDVDPLFGSLDTLRFWLARGVDGFRIDVLSLLVDEFGDDRVRLAELVLGNRYLAALPAGGWPNWVLGNHDVSRVASRVGPAQARVAAMLLLTLPGTPILYQGDELGLGDVPIPPDQVMDPVARLMPGRGRDPERTPMPWEGGPGAGFTTGRPWLPLGDDNQARHVAAQRDDPASMLTLHRRLLRLRRSARPCMPAPTTRSRPAATSWPTSAALPAPPLPGRPQPRPRPTRLAGPGLAVAGRVALSTHPDRDGDPVAAPLDLRGDEGVVVELG